MSNLRIGVATLARAWDSHGLATVATPISKSDKALVGLATGGRTRIRGRVVEFYGGAVAWFVRRLPGGSFALAITLGHTILGQTDAGLDIARDHEMVHVRQYERWGPLMGPAYLLCSLVLWLRGKDAYRDNPFERQAYDEVPEE